MKCSMRISCVRIGSLILLAFLGWGILVPELAEADVKNSGIVESEDTYHAVERLRESWRMNPLDESVIHQMMLLRSQIENEDQIALTHLVHGLKEYLSGRAHVAARLIARARQSVTVQKFSDELLPVPLASLEDKAVAGSQASRIISMCPQCGDSGFKDCPNQFCWRSFGSLPCTACQGSGKERTEAITPEENLRSCSQCKGFSLVRCPACDGEGWIRCGICHLPLQDGLAVETIAAIRRLIAMASHRVLGGPGIYLSSSLIPSPRFIKPDANPEGQVIFERKGDFVDN